MVERSFFAQPISCSRLFRSSPERLSPQVIGGFVFTETLLPLLIT